MSSRTVSPVWKHFQLTRAGVVLDRGTSGNTNDILTCLHCRKVVGKGIIDRALGHLGGIPKLGANPCHGPDKKNFNSTQEYSVAYKAFTEARDEAKAIYNAKVEKKNKKHQVNV